MVRQSREMSKSVLGISCIRFVALEGMCRVYMGFRPHWICTLDEIKLIVYRKIELIAVRVRRDIYPFIWRRLIVGFYRATPKDIFILSLMIYS